MTVVAATAVSMSNANDILLCHRKVYKCRYTCTNWRLHPSHYRIDKAKQMVSDYSIARILVILYACRILGGDATGSVRQTRQLRLGRNS